ncbi:uncharacterized protein [Rutidosis leptorrhynchoides]|uniref:uncharacterized protein n=1 Tax=Rutidosis leptorrhynchoides TaxID=125765 RepID=UPI003A991684
MGKQRRNQRKNAAMLDSDDTDSLSSSSSLSDQILGISGEEVQDDKESLLDQNLDALFEKRGETREKALVAIIEAFNISLPYEFVSKKFATMLHQCLNCIKKGSAKEIALASHVIGLLALITGSGKKAKEILEDADSPISEALKSSSDSSKITSLLECLAVITFVGANEPEETNKYMQIIWQVLHAKLGPNVFTTKLSPQVITAMVSASSFLLTTMDGRTLDSKNWIGSISYFSTLIRWNDRSMRIAAGEALALIFEIGNLEKVSVRQGYNVKDVMQIQGLKGEILNQVRFLSVEAAGKGSAKKDLNNQRNTFRDVLEYIENGYSPETSLKIGGDSFTTKTWSQLIQLNFLKSFLRGGFVKHMQDNEFLHKVFDFTPKKKQGHASETEKKKNKSQKSALNKERTQYLNKQRMKSQCKNAGRFAIGCEE